ncbi:MAG: hypothetical protein ACH350_00270 [Parachlamydiaceae bacterium]
MLQSLHLLQNQTRLLSDYTPPHSTFENIENIIAGLRDPAFCHLALRKRFKHINQILTQLILNAPPQAFLLSAILDFFHRINQEKLLKEILDLPSFEFWLNHFSELSDQDNHTIRAKIIGKHLPREEYQLFFPIGMGKTYFGSHFVTAHLSPDVDTMIASFWGWMDAFGARVGSGLHLWCLPDGPPDSPVTSFFKKLVGTEIFTYTARTASSINLTAMDLLTQKFFTKELGQVIVSSIEHERNDKAIILVNQQGHYLGDWRSSNMESIRQVVVLFKSCLHWFENNLHSRIISLFADNTLSAKNLAAFNASIFDVKIKDCEPAQDFSHIQKTRLNDFLCKVLELANGIEGTFADLNQTLNQASICGLLHFQQQVETLGSTDLFDEKGCLKEDRPRIFNYLKELIKHFDQAIFEVSNYVERLDIVLKIKYEVLNFPYTYLTLGSDVNEMRQKMQNHDFLTVVIHESDGSLFPVGVVRAEDLREQGLGTVSFRDFSSLDEVKMASCLEVISIVDHHKSSLKTVSVPTALIGDVQSCNVLMAEQAFKINDQYSLGGMNNEEIEKQILLLCSSPITPSNTRLLHRLLQRRMVVQRKHPYFVHPSREFFEYVTFLQAILDDTDLLTKASSRDIDCVAQLLNRLKSLSIKEEVEIIMLDDIPRGEKFVKEATQRILQQVDMYSLYKQIYRLRESEVESNLILCVEKLPSNIFLDTKEQNGCARVGQTKLFASNFPLLLKNIGEIRQIWLNQSQSVFEEKPEIDLYLHMISTIASAEEVHNNQIGPYTHQDELWLWTPGTQAGYRHLNSFLAGFQYSVKTFEESLSLEFIDNPPEEFKCLFDIHFPQIPRKHSMANHNRPIAVLRFKAGALNSRKSMITPFLPRLT